MSDNSGADSVAIATSTLVNAAATELDRLLNQFERGVKPDSVMLASLLSTASIFRRFKPELFNHNQHIVDTLAKLRLSIRDINESDVQAAIELVFLNTADWSLRAMAFVHSVGTAATSGDLAPMQQEAGKLLVELDRYSLFMAAVFELPLKNAKTHLQALLGNFASCLHVVAQYPRAFLLSASLIASITLSSRNKYRKHEQLIEASRAVFDGLMQEAEKLDWSARPAPVIWQHLLAAWQQQRISR